MAGIARSTESVPSDAGWEVVRKALCVFVQELKEKSGDSTANAVLIVEALGHRVGFPVPAGGASPLRRVMVNAVAAARSMPPSSERLEALGECLGIAAADVAKVSSAYFKNLLSAIKASIASKSSAWSSLISIQRAEEWGVSQFTCPTGRGFKLDAAVQTLAAAVASDSTWREATRRACEGLSMSILVQRDVNKRRVSSQPRSMQKAPRTSGAHTSPAMRPVTNNAPVKAAILPPSRLETPRGLRSSRPFNLSAMRERRKPESIDMLCSARDRDLRDFNSKCSSAQIAVTRSPPDGNCFYYSFAQGLQHLRRSTDYVSHMRTHRAGDLPAIDVLSLRHQVRLGVLEVAEAGLEGSRMSAAWLLAVTDIPLRTRAGKWVAFESPQVRAEADEFNRRRTSMLQASERGEVSAFNRAADKVRELLRLYANECVENGEPGACTWGGECNLDLFALCNYHNVVCTVLSEAPPKASGVPEERPVLPIVVKLSAQDPFRAALAVALPGHYGAPHSAFEVADHPFHPGSKIMTQSSEKSMAHPFQVCVLLQNAHFSACTPRANLTLQAQLCNSQHPRHKQPPIRNEAAIAGGPNNALVAVKLSEPPFDGESPLYTEPAFDSEGDPEQIIATIGEGNCHSYGPIHLKRKDLQTVCGRAWVNDEIINAYLFVVTNAEQQKRGQLRVSFMNSFLYSKLTDNSHTKGGRNAGSFAYCFANVKRWGRKTKSRRGLPALHDLDLLLVPINHDSQHWSLVAVNFRHRLIQHYDSLRGSSQTQAEASRASKVILRWIGDFAAAQQGNDGPGAIDIQHWGVDEMRGIPTQTNGWDCGVFVCAFAKYLASSRELSFQQSDMPLFRQEILRELLINGQRELADS